MSALAVMPSWAQRLLAATAKSTFADLDCPYADHGVYSRCRKWMSSKTTPDSR